MQIGTENILQNEHEPKTELNMKVCVYVRACVAWVVCDTQVRVSLGNLGIAFAASQVCFVVSRGT